MSAIRLTPLLSSKFCSSALHPPLQTSYTPQSRFLQTLPQTKPPSNPKTTSDPPTQSLFGFLDNLGATSKLVKIVLITSFTIVGTMETVFCSKVLWAKFGPQADKAVDGEVNERVTRGSTSFGRRGMVMEDDLSSLKVC
jgi:hypothetical protein